MAKVLEIPDEFRKRGVPTKHGAKSAPPKIVTNDQGMNKTEAAYAAHLELRRIAGEILSWKFNCVRLKIATGKKAAWYKGDFFVELIDILGRQVFEVHETKGFWREAARVRIKVAAGLYPYFRFVAVERKGGGWEFEEF